MREIDVDAVQELLRQQTSDVILALLEIEHENLSSPIRVVNNHTDITYETNTYTGFPFKITLPAENDENIGDVTLQIDAVDQSIVNAVRNMTTRPTAKITVIRVPFGSSVPEKLLELSDFVLSNVSFQVLTLKARLGYQEFFLSQKATKDIFSKDMFPGAF
jgi:hypothetical protein